jgi:hypothetical protein
VRKSRRPSQRPLPTQDNITQKRKEKYPCLERDSTPSILVTKRPRTRSDSAKLSRRPCIQGEAKIWTCVFALKYMGSYIHSFSCRSQLEHRAPFAVPVITRTIRHTVGLLWTSDQPVAETSIYTGQHNRQTQETNFHVPSGIRTCDPSNQVVADLHLRPRGHWDR